MQNGDIKNFRLSNQCSAGNGMLLQAMADQFGVHGHRVRRRRVRGRAVAEVQLRLRGVPRLRPRQLPEGGLLEGGAARRAWRRCCRRTSGSTSCRSRAWPRSGTQVRAAGRHAVQPRRGQGAGRLHQGARAGRRGLRPPAHAARPARSAPRSRRCAWSSAAGTSTFIGLDAAIDLDVHGDQRRGDALPLLPEQLRAHVHRHRDARRHARARYISGFSCEKGTVESGRRDARARQGAQEADEAVPEPGRLRGEAGCSGTSTTPRRCPSRRRADRRRRGREGRCSARPARGGRRGRSSARAPRRASGAPRRAHRHPARAQHLLDRRRSAAPTSRRSASRSRTSCSPTRPPRRCGLEGGKYGSIDPCYPSKVAQAHIHNLLFHHHSRTKKPLNYIFFPILTHVPELRAGHAWTTRRARSSPARPTS